MEIMEQFAAQVCRELTEDILPFWMKRMADPSGGFYGRISGDGILDKKAPKGAIMNARLLWTFSNAFRIFSAGLQASGPAGKAGKTGRPEASAGHGEPAAAKYLETATRAKREIIDRFYDPVYGGVWWSLTPEGSPSDRKKQIYAIAFAIYGLAEYGRATGDKEAIEYAIRLFHDIENHSFDQGRNGYFEAFTENWEEIGDMRLSDKDANESKTMNTHLHILEAYTGLYRVWKDPLLRERLRNLILIFAERIVGPDGHLKLFFDENWNCNYEIVSYGHDIEASWLLHEAAMVLGDTEILDLAEKLVPRIAAAAGEGFTAGKGMIYEKKKLACHEDKTDGESLETADRLAEIECSSAKAMFEIDADRHWWVQAETVVGYFNLWQHFGDREALKKAIDCWDFIKGNIIDREGGEWFWSLRADGTENRTDDKAGFWKCPYHNGRMCMEIIERVASASTFPTSIISTGVRSTKGRNLYI